MSGPNEPADPSERTVAGRYRLGPMIGRGGMATVHRADDIQTGRAVAVKLLRREVVSDRDLAQRFRREALAATVLRHPNIVACLDTGTDDGQPFLVMDLIDGDDLAARLRAGGALDPRQVVRIGLDVARGMGAAHLRGIVHRDIKPGNILLAGDGRAMITDFGIARLALDAEAAVPGTTLGSVHYFSPEQARGVTTTPASDVYGLGLVLYEALTGRRAWSGATTDALALARIGRPAPSAAAVRPEVPPALDALVRRAMAPEPGDRYPSGGSMASALESVGAGMDVAPPLSAATATGATPAASAAVPIPTAGTPSRVATPLAPVSAPRARRGRRTRPRRLRFAPGRRLVGLGVVGLVTGALLLAALPSLGGVGSSNGVDPTDDAGLSAGGSVRSAIPRPARTPRPSATPATSPRPTVRPTPRSTTARSATPQPAAGADLCETFFDLPCGLGPGTYTPSRYSPAIDVTVGSGWSSATQAADTLILQRQEGRLLFASGVTDVISNGELFVTSGRAKDVIERFTVTQGVAATKPARVRIDGQRGMSVDLTPLDGEDLPLFSVGDTTYALAPGRTTRMVVLDVGTGNLLLAIEPAGDGTLEDILGSADDVAGSIRFR